MVVEPVLERYAPGMIVGRQIAAALRLLRWGAADLAEKAGVSISTVKRAELAEGVPSINAMNLARIERALEDGGVTFVTEPSGSIGVRFKTPLRRPSEAARV